MALVESVPSVDGDGAEEAPAVVDASGGVRGGVFVVGIFGGVERDQAAGRTSVRVAWQGPRDAKAWPRRLEVTPYDPQTGEVSRAYEAVTRLAIGAPVECAVYPEARPYKGSAFIVWVLLSCRAL